MIDIDRLAADIVALCDDGYGESYALGQAERTGIVTCEEASAVRAFWHERDVAAEQVREEARRAKLSAEVLNGMVPLLATKPVAGRGWDDLSLGHRREDSE